MIYGPIFGTNNDMRVDDKKVYSNLQYIHSSYDKEGLGDIKPDQVLFGNTACEL